MKRFYAVIVTLAIVLSASLAFASGDVSVDGKVSNKNEVGQSQGIYNSNDFSQHGDNISGAFPYVPGMPGIYPPNYFPGYNRQINDLSSEMIAMTTPTVTLEGFAKFKSRLIKAKGEDFFAKLEENIRSRIRTEITNPKLFSPSQAVHTITNLEKYDLSMLEGMGTTAVDSKLEKEGEFDLLVYRQELYMFAGVDVLQDGVNVRIPVDAFRAYITPSGTTKGAGVSGGLLKWIGSLVGISASAQIETSEQKTVMRGDAAVTYLLFHVDDVKRFLHPPKKELVVEEPKPEEPKTPVCDANEIRELHKQIEEKLKETKKCKSYCFNNLRLRSLIGYLFRDLYICTGDQESKHEAIRNYEIAARNYHFGHDIKQNKVEADRVIADVYRNWKRIKY